MTKAWTVATLAAAWDCSESHIKSQIRKGHIRSFRVGNLIRITNEEKIRCESAQNTPEATSGLDGEAEQRLRTIETRAVSAAAKLLAN